MPRRLRRAFERRERPLCGLPERRRHRLSVAAVRCGAMSSKGMTAARRASWQGACGKNSQCSLSPCLRTPHRESIDPREANAPGQWRGANLMGSLLAQALSVRTTTLGSTSGVQNRNCWSARTFGSPGKCQPPAKGEGVGSRGLGAIAEGRLVARVTKIVPVIRIPAQKLEGEARRAQFVDIVVSFRRLPIILGHAAQPFYDDASPPGADVINVGLKRKRRRRHHMMTNREIVRYGFSRSRSRKPFSTIQRARAKWLS
jgi:hypothetical protein